MGDMESAQESKTQQPPNQPLVGIWLLLVCMFVLAMVVVGGATRLTDSGLSITEWDLGKGLTPPLSDARWAEEFALYQRTTEYQLQNRGMSLAEFQSIYWWEWGHRFLGKMIGLVFALPFAFFWATGRLRGRFAPVLVLFALGGLQGAIGWWMVTSGLWSGLDVSPIRLAVHLGMAFVIAGLALWLALDCFGWPRASTPSVPVWAPPAFLALLFAQVILGAFLAGSDGGAAYADWPLIGGQVWPSGAFEQTPLWQNHASQHLLHRTTGYLVALLAVAIAFLSRNGKGAGEKVGVALGLLALAQAGLGVATVLAASPVSLSLAHQFGAAALWLTGVAVWKAQR
ncbi:heme A synthase [alpha proteobacterium U9-1i]|nr:heme A synthase [alpha proteobacterium U9-1i]